MYPSSSTMLRVTRVHNEEDQPAKPDFLRHSLLHQGVLQHLDVNSLVFYFPVSRENQAKWASLERLDQRYSNLFSKEIVTSPYVDSSLVTLQHCKTFFDVYTKFPSASV